MRRMEVRPDSSRAAEEGLSEAFDHPSFSEGTKAQKQSIMLASAHSKYEGELAYPFDNYFGIELTTDLRDKTALDLGCFTGGVSVAWYERYGLAEISGVDVRPEFVEAATMFARSRSVEGDFRLGAGEMLPFADESFDAVLSFDVLEHVHDVAATLDECHRVLRPGGRIWLVFPGYFHPIEHHLSLVTRTPCLHWLFSGEVLVEAYSELIAERGTDAEWYARSSNTLEQWERGHTINGTTVAGFRNLVREGEWHVELRAVKPLGSIGRRAAKKRWVKGLAKLLRPLAKTPVAEEAVIHRIAYILEKRR